jgi:hypothetical protein
VVSQSVLNSFVERMKMTIIISCHVKVANAGIDVTVLIRNHYIYDLYFLCVDTLLEDEQHRTSCMYEVCSSFPYHLPIQSTYVCIYSEMLLMTSETKKLGSLPNIYSVV